MPLPERTENPQKTGLLQQKYEAEVYNRFRSLKGDVRKAVAEDDLLGLSGGGRRGLGELEQPRRDFRFDTDSKKHAAFMQWLNRQISNNVLEEVSSESVRNGSHWTGTYIRAAYKRGVRDSETFLRKQGYSIDTVENVFNKPIHADKLRIIYSRNYNNLQNITSAASANLSQKLTEGLAQGFGPRKMARKLNQELDDVGINRGRMLARTETAYAHTEASLNRYEDANTVKKVKVLIESDACPVCTALSGRTWALDNGSGILPAHPNCRCAIAPITKSED